jgi:hypothetical protein
VPFMTLRSGDDFRRAGNYLPCWSILYPRTAYHARRFAGILQSMGNNRADLKAFFRHGCHMGLNYDRNAGYPTDEEIDEWFEAGYKHWRESRKEVKAANSVNPDVVYERWEAGKPGAQEPLFKPDELKAAGRQKP